MKSNIYDFRSRLYACVGLVSERDAARSRRTTRGDDSTISKIQKGREKSYEGEKKREKK